MFYHFLLCLSVVVLLADHLLAHLLVVVRLVGLMSVLIATQQRVLWRLVRLLEGERPVVWMWTWMWQWVAGAV